MIKEVTIRGFRSIRRLDSFPLKPLNVLIGANRAGKSNFIDFFRFLSECAKERMDRAINSRGGMQSILWAKGAEKLEMCILAEPSHSLKSDKQLISYYIEIGKTAGAGPSYELNFEKMTRNTKGNLKRKPPPSVELLVDHGKRYLDYKEYEKEAELKTVTSPDGKTTLWVSTNQLALVQFRDPKNYPEMDMMRKYLSSFVCHYPFVTNIDSPMRKSMLLQSGTDDQPATRLLPGGENLSNVYHHLKNNAKWKDTWQEIKNVLSVAFPGFTDIFFHTDAGHGHIILSWEDKYFPNRAFSAFELSDGVLATLCLLAVLYDPDPPPLIFIDEPEVGLHPELIKIFAGLLVQASEQTQIIVATQSPELVSYLKPEDIVVVENEAGESKLKRLSSKKLKTWLQDFSLGELWLQGEIGGRP